MQRVSMLLVLVLTGLLMTSSCSNQNIESRVSDTDDATHLESNQSPTPISIGEENFAKQWKAEFDKMKSEITGARDKWEQNNINSYAFVAAKYIGGVSSPWNRSPVLIKVDNGQAVAFEVVDKNDISSLARTDGFEELNTIDKLFDYMLRELENGRMVTADYDKSLGYPKFVSISISYESHGSRSIQISKLTRAD